MAKSRTLLDAVFTHPNGRRFAVPGDVPPGRLHALLERVDDDLELVAYLPRRPDGTVDADALDALPPSSARDRRAATAALLAVEGVRDAHVTAKQLEPLREEPVYGILPAELRRAPAPAPALSVAPGPVGTAPSYLRGAALEKPDDAPTTLAEALDRAAARFPSSTVAHLDEDGELLEDYAALAERARRVAAGLRGRGIAKGTAVVGQLPASRWFFPAFWGAILAECPFLPSATPPDYEQDHPQLDRVRHACETLGRAVVITRAAQVDALAARLAPDHDVEVLAIEELLESDASIGAPPSPDPEDIALYFQTSGSTGRPKVVPLSHRNLLAQAFGCNQARQQTERDVSLNWMPLDHVGSCVPIGINDVVAGSGQVHITTERILADPLRWLECCERFGATISWAPNFGYALIAEAEGRLQDRDFDLRRLRYLINAGEAVVARTARRFLAVLTPFGLPADAMRPAFGMSELCSGITYADDFLLETTSDADVHVRLGGPIPGSELRIVDEGGQIVHEGEVGELQVRGPSVFRGYLRPGEPTPNREDFDDDGWFRTGDLGRVRRGALLVTGRAKDVIVVHGVKYPSRALESAAEEVDGVAPAFTGALGIRDEDGAERLVLFFCPEDGDLGDDALAGLLQAIREAVHEQHGLAPSDVLPLLRDEVPRTGIGKLDRKTLKARYEAGAYFQHQLRVDRLLGRGRGVPRWFYAPELAPAPPREGAAPLGRVVLHGPDGEGTASLQTALERRGAHVLRAVPEEAFVRRSATRYGVDPRDPSHLALLLAHLREDGPRIDAVVDTTGLDLPRAGDEHDGLAFRAAFSWLRTLLTGHGAGPRPALAIVAARAGDGDPRPLGGRHAVTRLVRTAARELEVLHVDVGEALDAEAVVDELAAGVRGEIVHREGARLRPRLAPVDFEALPLGELPVRAGAFYVVTGGLSETGSAVAAWLLEEYDARVLALDVTQEPAPGEDEPTGPRASRLQTLARLRGLGAIRYEALDVRDRPGVEAAVRAAGAAFGVGPLAGVFHFAGIRVERPLRRLPYPELEDALSARVQGARHLDALLGREPASVFVSYSFGEVDLPSPLGAAQAASAATLRALCADRRADGARHSHDLALAQWHSLDLRPGTRISREREALGYHFVDSHDLLDATRLVLSRRPPPLTVGLDPTHPRVRRAAERGPLPYLETMGFAVADETTPLPEGTVRVDALPRRSDGAVDGRRLVLQARRRRAAGRRPPHRPRELQLAQVWIDVLGVPLQDLRRSFFDDGGDSLSAVRFASRVREAFDVDLAIQALFADPTAAAILSRIDGAQGSDRAPIEAARREAGEGAHAEAQRVPASPAQQRLWLVDQLQGASPEYNLGLAFRLDGPLDHGALNRALTALITRHEALRATFVADGPRVLQVLWPAEPVEVRAVDLEGGEAALDGWLGEVTREPFDLEAGPLYGVALARLAPERHVLLLVIHHVVADGWSFGILGPELGRLYRAAAAGEALEGTAPAVTYADVAAHQQRMLDSGALEGQLAWWVERLRALPALDLPTDRPRPSVQTHRGAAHRLALDEDLVASLRVVLQEEEATLFMGLLAAYAFVLSRYAGQVDFGIGTPVAGRDRAEVEDLVGFFVNTVVLRMDLAARPSYRELLRRVREVVVETFEHPEVHFDRIVERLRPDRDPSRSLLYQTLFVLQPELPYERDWGPVAATHHEYHPGTAQLDLVLNLTDRGGRVEGWLEYNADLFEAATAASMAGHFAHVLKAGAEAPDRPLRSVHMLANAERRQLLEEWAGRRTPVEAATAHALVRAQAEARPHAEALTDGVVRLTYGELWACVDRLAETLRHQGLGPDGIVALAMPRGPELIVSLLAVLEAGAAYLPVDPTYPADRVAYMLADARPALVLTDDAARLPEGTRALRVDPSIADPSAPPLAVAATAPRSDHEADLSSLAYVIYTSGSTGRPKGVLVEHRGIGNMARAVQEGLAIDASSRVAQFASASFDASVYEVFITLTAGATLCVVADDRRAGGPLEQYLKSEGVTHVTLPPSVAAGLDPAAQPALEVLGLAGEACPPLQVQRFAREGRRVFNLYGPTEFTVCATFEEAVPDGRVPPIGGPLPNCTAYVLDELQDPVPPGVPGELCLGGIQLARGYLRRPDLNELRFQEIALADGAPTERLYRTGDRVRWRRDGTLEFLGRLDRQVKVRGFRIELGEVEAILGQHPAVSQAAVVVQGGGADTRLVAFVGVGDAALDPAELRAFLGARVPDFMVPQSLQVLRTLPLSPSGKVDVAALAHRSQARATTTYLPPRTERGRAVAALWAERLGVERVGLLDDFFDLGGHSLLAAQVARELGGVLGRHVSPALLVRSPTLGTFLEALERRFAGEPVDDGAFVAQAMADQRLDGALGNAPPPPGTRPERVVLTGATGFLGAFLAAELLRRGLKVTAAVRAADAGAAAARVRGALETYGEWEDRFDDGLAAVPFDLAADPVPEAVREALAEAGGVVHNAALVEMVRPYRQLAPVNVEGTRRLLAVALEHGRPFHYVSTLSVFPKPEGGVDATAREDDPREDPRGLNSGYAQSKWVAERLVRAAGQRGLPVTIHRASAIMGHRRTGESNRDKDVVHRLLEACVVLGLAPRIDTTFNFVPVDHCATAIAEVVEGGLAPAHPLHLASPENPPFDLLWEWMEELGYRLEVVPYRSWRSEVEARADTELRDSLGPLLPFFDLTQEDMLHVPRVDTRLTTALLAGRGIGPAMVGASQLRLWLQRLVERGAFPAPGKR
jgi:amino acid adenylation domain-containing protein/thioester reductase-like protein